MTYNVLGAVGEEISQSCLERAAVRNKCPCVWIGASVARRTTKVVTTVGANGEH